jgi:FkbM family methyltransferase
MKIEAVYVGHDRILLRTPNRFKMYVDARDVSIAPHLILDGVWEEWTEAVLRKLLRPGMTVVEIGANVGFFTLIESRTVGENGRVIAFEADPVLAGIARDNLEINGEHRVARIVQAAVADRTGTMTFYQTDRHRGGGSIVGGLEQIPHNPSDSRVSITVECTTLDDFLAREGIARVDLLRIDAEGAEAAILRGAKALLESKAPLILMMEFAPRFFETAGSDPQAALSSLLANGFTLSRIDEKHRRYAPAAPREFLAHEFSEIVAIRK